MNMKYIKPYKIWESAETLWKLAPSSIHGQGVFAVVDLPAETNIGLLHTILPDGYDHTQLGHMYNHSGEPNCYNKRVGDQRFLVTIRPIKSGEELTGDYRLQPDLEQPQAGWIGESADQFWTGYERLVDLGMIDLADWDKIRDDVMLLVKERLAGHYPDLDVEKLAFDEIRIHQPGKGRRDPYYCVYIDKGVNHNFKLWSCRLIVGFQQAPGRSDSQQLIQVPDHFWTRPIGGHADIANTVAMSKWIADEIIAWMDRVFVPWIGVEVPETP